MVDAGKEGPGGEEGKEGKKPKGAVLMDYCDFIPKLMYCTTYDAPRTRTRGSCQCRVGSRAPLTIVGDERGTN